MSDQTKPRATTPILRVPVNPDGIIFYWHATHHDEDAAAWKTLCAAYKTTKKTFIEHGWRIARVRMEEVSDE